MTNGAFCDPCRSRAPSMAQQMGSNGSGERTPQVPNKATTHALAANQPSGTLHIYMHTEPLASFSRFRCPQHRPQLRRYARRGAHAYSVVVVTRRQGHALGVGVVSTVAMQGGAEEAAGRCAAAAAAVAHGAGCSAGCCREAQAGAPGPEGGFQGCGGAMQARDEARRHSMQEVLVHPAPPTSTLMTPARPSRGQLPI